MEDGHMYSIWIKQDLHWGWGAIWDKTQPFLKETNYICTKDDQNTGTYDLFMMKNRKNVLLEVRWNMTWSKQIFNKETSYKYIFKNTAFPNRVKSAYII